MDNEAYEKDLADFKDPIKDSNGDSFSDESIPVKKSFAQIVREYPTSVFFIVGNEFCERFSYYGMKAVLTLYLINQLKLANKDATAVYHGFTVFAYFTPILGCILADGYIGKFHTILWISLLYAAGNIILAVAATRPTNEHPMHPALDIVGLIIIAIGTGGIKPCVSAFGGDQFQKGQEVWLEKFFSVFYFAINAGSTISTFITPIFRTRHCNGEDSCYPLAFGVPACLMVLSCFFFVIGSHWYRKSPPKDNIIVECIKMTFKSLNNKRKSHTKKARFLDHYMDDHLCENDSRCLELGRCHKLQLTKDLWAVFRVLVMYLPMPFFWALYDQQGSKWIIQGTQMSSKIGSWDLLPDQMPTVNPILIMAFIPIFSAGVYPLAAKCVKVTPLRKMAAGGMLAAVSYVITGLVQHYIDASLPVIPSSHHSRITLLNYANCDMNITLMDNTNNVTFGNYHVPALLKDINQSAVNFEVKTTKDKSIALSYTAFSSESGCVVPQPKTSANKLMNEKASYISFDNHQMTELLPEILKKPENGEGENYIAFTFMLSGFTNLTNITVCRPEIKHKKFLLIDCRKLTDPERIRNLTVSSYNATGWADLKPGTWFVYVPSHPNITDFVPTDWSNYSYKFKFDEQGSVFSMFLRGNSSDNIYTEKYTFTPGNDVSIAWQLPQYIVVTAAEILFSITGLEFSYSQSPMSMKSVMQAVWLLSVAVGDCIVIAVVEAEIFPDQANVYFLFAGIMVVVMLIFIALAHFYYEYVYYIQEHEEKEPPPGLDASQLAKEKRVESF